MDYNAFFSQPYQNLTAANLQAANNAFSLNTGPPNASHRQQQQQQQQPQNNHVSQLQQNVFYMDPFDTKIEPTQTNDLDHASYESETFLDEFDDLARIGNIPQNGPQALNQSPQGLQQNNIPKLSMDFDLADLNQDFQDSAGGNNTNKRKAQNRAAQRAFRERKERHVKELEAKVAALEEANTKMREENDRLKKQLRKLESENNNLKGSNVTFTFPQFIKSGNYSPPLSDRESLLDTNNQQQQQQQQQQTDIPMYDFEEFTIKPVSPTSLSDSSTGQKSDNSPIPPPAPTTQQVSTKVQNIMMQYQDFTQHHPTTSPATTAVVEGHGFLDCPKVWERIVTHPRFDEVDIEELCAELNSKVRIQVERAGPSVEGHELEAALDQAIEDVVARS